MNDILAYFTLEDHAGKYKLSALYDFEKRKYYMPSLEFMEIPDGKYSKLPLIWDNPTFYIINCINF